MRAFLKAVSANTFLKKEEKKRVMAEKKVKVLNYDKLVHAVQSV